MAIATLAGYQASARQRIIYRKNATSWGGSTFYSNVQIGGSPGAAGGPGNTANGIVPAGGAGYPAINAFAGTAYITGVEAALLSSSSLFGGLRYILADLVWYAGAYSTANVTLTSQPSFASRLPGGSFVGLQLWSEGVGGGGTTTTFNVGYTNESGTPGRSTGAIDIDVIGSNVGLQAQIFPLQAGDAGVQRIDSVTVNGGTHSANLMVVRPLVYGRVNWTRNKGVARKWFDHTHAPQILSNASLVTLVACEGSGNGSLLVTAPLELQIEVCAA